MSELFRSEERMVTLFNEWRSRFIEDPNEFDSEFFKIVTPDNDYGQCCVEYLKHLDQELPKDGEK